MNEAKKLGQLNMSVDEQIVARSTRVFCTRLGWACRSSEDLEVD